MRKISNATAQRILEASDIVEVVSDFVSLKRRGANWVGLCPFHSDRRPSFYVSKSKGLCKCFSCGEGGSAVGFIMKLEHLTYPEALRYLAKKYNIEVEDREMTPEEEKAESARENMMAVNDFAMRYFEDYMLSNPEGRDVGLSYFRYRGISEQMIQRFHLGFAPEGRDTFYRRAIERGYSEEWLVQTGLCTRTEDGKIFDRFRGRVIYPILGISGKPVAFGGRTLKKEKTIAKYVNSPESEIYSKRRELYGLFQAKQAISKENKCIIVEGYMDVISMHQAGICNVVASSGTALTVEQVRLIKRFTTDVTLIYDADAAGIKASLRGIELLLQDGMDIKVLLLPEGEDPDSFAQSHSSTEVTEFIKANETDFITFMARILMEGSGDDPSKRARVITRIVRTIALIPNEITRNVYIQECSRILFISEDVLLREVGKAFNELAQKTREERQREESLTFLPPEQAIASVTPQHTSDKPQDAPSPGDHAARLRNFELAVVKLVARYGNYAFAEGLDENDNPVPLTVLDYVLGDLEGDGIALLNADAALLLNEASRLSTRTWEADLHREQERLSAIRAEEFAKGVDEIRATATDVGSISAMEKSLTERIDAEYNEGIKEYTTRYLAKLLCSSEDDTVRNLATELVAERHILSKMHTKYARVDTEQDLLGDLVPRTLNELKNAIVWTRILDVKAEIKQSVSDYDRVMALMGQLRELESMRSSLARLIGDRVITPMK